MDEAPSPRAGLESLRRDLRDGRLAALAGHLDRLARLEATLARGDVSPADLPGLRAEALRTGQLLQASASGVRAALRRLREASSPAATYAPDGRRTTLGGGDAARGTRA